MMTESFNISSNQYENAIKKKKLAGGYNKVNTFKHLDFKEQFWNLLKTNQWCKISFWDYPEFRLSITNLRWTSIKLQWSQHRPQATLDPFNKTNPSPQTLKPSNLCVYIVHHQIWYLAPESNKGNLAKTHEKTVFKSVCCCSTFSNRWGAAKLKYRLNWYFCHVLPV